MLFIAPLILKETPLMRKTKIICTIGPATESFEMLEKLAIAGMNVVRLNMSHGDHESHAKVIKAVRTLNKKQSHPYRYPDGYAGARNTQQVTLNMT